MNEELKRAVPQEEQRQRGGQMHEDIGRKTAESIQMK
jgi:hypothetical protein